MVQVQDPNVDTPWILQPSWKAVQKIIKNTFLVNDYNIKTLLVTILNIANIWRDKNLEHLPYLRW